MLGFECLLIKQGKTTVMNEKFQETPLLFLVNDRHW